MNNPLLRKLANFTALSKEESRAVVAAYDGVATQLILDGDLPGARAWLRQLLMVVLGR